jgi:hypothetical protein
MGFKEDADFARFVSMGAIATDGVRQHLANAYGHRAIELERYAMANKVWQTKVKRLRLPDLLCVRCGRRVESKGKSQLGVVLSHSDAPDRAWDDGGMRDDDLFAFVRVDMSGPQPHVSEPLYLRTEDLRAVRVHARESDRKAISEGSEMTLTWKGWVPKKSGIVAAIDEQGRIFCEYDDGSTYRYGHWRNWPERRVYIAPGGAFRANETMVAGIVSPPPPLTCPGDTWDLVMSLHSADDADRYAAIRTAGILGREDLRASLIELADGEGEDWRIRLEALASLARLDPDAWTGRITDVALDSSNPDDRRIESVFVLSEIPTDAAALALAEVAAPAEDHPREVRAAALWGLGQGIHPRPDLLLPFTIDDDDFVALHAIAGLDELPDELTPQLISWINEGDDRRAAAAAQLLLRHRAVNVLLAVASSDDAGSLWALRALGDLPPEFVYDRGGDQLTEKVADALAPLWVAQRDWLRVSGVDGLQALDVQKVRFNPLVPDA